MRLLLSFLLSTASLALNAQVTDEDVDRQVRESIKKRVEEDNARKMGPSHPLLKIEKSPMAPGGLVPQKPGVYALPLDGMPCVVPDTASIAAIPNAAPKILLYRKDMPNRIPQKKAPVIK